MNPPGFGVDPAFRAAAARARARRRRRLVRPILLGLLALGLATAGWRLARDRPETPPPAIATGDDLAMVPEAEPDPDMPAAPDPSLALRGLPRDPMVLRLSAGPSAPARTLPGPPGFEPGRAGPPAPDRLTLIKVGLGPGSGPRALDPPSSREDLALYQARRSRALARRSSTAPGDLALSLQPEAARRPFFADSLLRLGPGADLATALTGAGLGAEAARAAAGALPTLADPPRLAALRLRPGSGTEAEPELLQLSLYGADGYLTTLARLGAGRYARAADPWADRDLASEGRTAPEAPPRLLDAVYSAALGAGLGPDLTGEMIVLLAQRMDLGRPAAPDDRLRVLYATRPGPGGAARLFYVGLGGHSGCYVLPIPAGGHACAGAGSLAGSMAGATAGIDDAAAVETLVARIVHVESGGRADARNPLSSALGLGQFISSTWLRMMREHHPELTARMDRAALLALRTDPVLSVEMVYALARENAAYLAARGHGLTPGRLYLAHFLGAEGANRALSADPAAGVAEIMGPAVVSANPFLTGKTIGELLAWADRKMTGTAAPAVISPEIRRYRETVDAILATG
ncbi:hypothetical protein BYZ73_11715 [Rhodovulum viride]|uniref:Transglycosylase SLT domain-containing protein n=1 Tax=Rhodovulum viride TaxID=1231134 RepID=A0ABX9DI76_9RHOB|nr:lytic transglycosylase domain-containing protein [Rhodovulum viride]RAP41091.1 hypothetical protein BYZ73_11715 [Rhodovulum viride]